MAQASMRSQQVSSQTHHPVLETVSFPSIPSASAATYDLDDLLEIEGVVSLDVPREQPVPQTPWRFLSPDELDSELDHILGLTNEHARDSVSLTTETTHNTTALRTETSYLSTLPPVFATRNHSVDNELQTVLEYAYQTESTPDMTTSEDKQLLRQKIDDARSDWQRYCDFVSDEQLLPDEVLSVEEQPINEFDFGRPFSQQELAMFDDFDDEPSLFVEHDARIAAAQAAVQATNLAQYRDRNDGVE